jgi:glycosyltransferase involved in cell wall biosynthesis
VAEAVEAAREAGVRRVRVVAWRDLDHPDSGGSEIHLHEILRRWAAGGLEVDLLTGRVPGQPAASERAGYRVLRAGGPLSSLVGLPLRARRAPADATIEVWHGINFAGPLWIRGPRLAIAHHVHRNEFSYVLPRPAAWAARHQEGTLSPRLYRGTPLVTLSSPARDELVALGFDADSLTVVPPGVDGRFSPGGTRSPTPLLLTVGRLWPQKRVHLVVEAMARLRDRYPSAELVVVGDGPCRSDLVALARSTRARVRFPGRVDDTELVDLYRSAWMLASASFGEGWGMTITEAAACGTPAVVSVNTGHSQSVVHGHTGLLVDMSGVSGGVEGLVEAVGRVLEDTGLREGMGRNAVAHARQFDWDRVAARVLGVLAADAQRREQVSRGYVRKAGYQGVPAVAPTSRR